MDDRDLTWRRSIEDLQADMAAGRTTCVKLIEGYLKRIRTIDWAGPNLQSVIAVNPRAQVSAAAVDEARRAGTAAALAGVPILIKDNIECDIGVATTAGSLALRENVTDRNAPLVQRLVDAQAIILGKANLTEWANARSRRSIAGWSAIGGLVKNPYALDRYAGGSSSGSAAAVAAGLAAAAIGTETNGSIVGPASVNGLVGLKPTVGLVSRRHIIPNALSQDTAGPMTRCVRDAALLLTVMAGTDLWDPATEEADRRRGDYVAALAGATLQGRRLGILRYACRQHPAADDLFGRTLERLRDAGAVLVDIADHHPWPGLAGAETQILRTEFKAGLNAYLMSSPGPVRCRSLADVIAFNAATPRETALFGQDLFEAAERTAGVDDSGYRDAVAAARIWSREKGLDAMFQTYAVDALVAPTWPPARRFDRASGYVSVTAATSEPAIAGYPHLTVPMGQIGALPVGFSFIGPAWGEASLLSLGAAFEALIGPMPPPTFAASLDLDPELLSELSRHGAGTKP